MNKLKKHFYTIEHDYNPLSVCSINHHRDSIRVPLHSVQFGMEQFRSHIVQNDETYTEIKWKLIESTLKDADYLADISAREAANDIVSEVEKRYPDKK